MGVDLFDIKGRFYKLVSGEDVVKSLDDKESVRYFFNIWIVRKLVIYFILIDLKIFVIYCFKVCCYIELDIVWRIR